MRPLGSSPNPFVSRTSVRFRLARELPVRLRIYDAAGRHVRTLVDGVVAEGVHATAWDGRDERARSVAPGVYFHELRAAGQYERGKVIRVR